MKRVAKKGDEIDLVTGGRRVLKYLGRAGVAARIKRRLRRRERHEAKTSFKGDDDGEGKG